jgi:hypothetical protein
MGFGFGLRLFTSLLEQALRTPHYLLYAAVASSPYLEQFNEASSIPWKIYYAFEATSPYPVPEFIDPGRVNKPETFVSMTENERFELVFVKTGPMNSGTGHFTALSLPRTICVSDESSYKPGNLLKQVLRTSGLFTTLLKQVLRTSGLFTTLLKQDLLTPDNLLRA